MLNGWIKIYRKLLDEPVWLNSTAEQKVVLVTLLLSANHKSQKWDWGGNEFIVEPGQFVTSIKQIKELAGVSTKNVRTALKRFEKMDFLANQVAREGRLITICNWGRYQCSEGKGGKPSGKQVANPWQTPGKPPTVNPEDNKGLETPKNDKNVKNDKKKDKPSREAYRLSRLLWDLITERQPERRRPDFDKWAEDMDLLLRGTKGKRPMSPKDAEEVEEVIEWAQEDEFWQNNILSPAKLREKYDNLRLRME